MKRQHNQIPDQEFRYINAPALIEEEERAEGKKGTLIRGTAVFFDQLSRNLGWFREKFERGAFDDVLKNDIVALFNHDNNLILGRTTSNTLKVWSDDEGLHYEFEAPNTTAGRDLVESMKRGDVSQSSFSFSIQDEKWEEDEEQGEIRTVLKVKRLYDVSPVVTPAYPQTVSEIAKRSYDEWKKENQKPETPPTSFIDEAIETDVELRKLILDQ